MEPTKFEVLTWRKPHQYLQTQSNVHMHMHDLGDIRRFVRFMAGRRELTRRVEDWATGHTFLHFAGCPLHKSHDFSGQFTDHGKIEGPRNTKQAPKVANFSKSSVRVYAHTQVKNSRSVSGLGHSGRVTLSATRNALSPYPL